MDAASKEALARLRRKFEQDAAATASACEEACERVERLRVAFEKWAERSGYDVERTTNLSYRFDEAEADYAPHGVDFGVYVDFAMELAWCSFLAGDHIGRATP